MSLSTIVAWLNTLVAIPVIQSHQNTPAPAGDYISVAYVSSSGGVYPIVSKTDLGDDTVQFSAYRSVTINVDISVFSLDGDSILNDIKNAGSLPSYIDRPVMADCGNILGPAFFDDSGFSPQYTCEFSFRESNVTNRIDPRVNSIAIEGQIDDLDITVGYDHEE